MSIEHAILTAEPTTALLIDSQPPQPGIRGSHSPISALTSKGVEARRKLIVDGFKLKQDWLDGEHWRALAKNRHYRLPHWYIPLSTSKMETVLHDLGLGVEFYRTAFGLVNYSDLIARNPLMPLWVFAGLCLELGIVDADRSLSDTLTVQTGNQW
jgi:hypothetical protein